MEMFQYDFMQRALIAAVCMSLISPILGLLLILRRQSLMADTLSHVSLSGVALGLLLNASPTLVTILVVVIAAVIIEYLRQIYESYSEISIAILMSTGLAVALLLMNMKSGSGVKVDQFLFGSLVTVSSEQLIILMILAVLVLGLYISFRRPLYVLLFDEDTAFATGLPVRLMSICFTVITGMAISVMMPISGALLVASILVLPTSITMRFCKSFTTVILCAVGISVVGMITGLGLSYHYSTPPGATITMIFVAVLVVVNIVLSIAKVLGRRKV